MIKNCWSRFYIPAIWCKHLNCRIKYSRKIRNLQYILSIAAPDKVTHILETIQPLAKAYTQQIEQTGHAPPPADFILRERRQCGKMAYFRRWGPFCRSQWERLNFFLPHICKNTLLKLSEVKYCVKTPLLRIVKKDTIGDIALENQTLNTGYNWYRYMCFVGFLGSIVCIHLSLLELWYLFVVFFKATWCPSLPKCHVV